MYLMKSPHLKAISFNGKSLLYNSLFGTPLVVDEPTLSFLNNFGSPVSIKPFIKGDNGLIAQFFIQMLQDHILIVQGSDERRILENNRANYLLGLKAQDAFTAMTLLVSEYCNFHCSYCYQRRLSRRNISNDLYKPRIMNFDTALKAIDLLFASLNGSKEHEINIGFNGGEPLMNWNLIDKVMHYVSNDFAEDFSVNWGINTNASLVTPQIASVLKKFDVAVNTSLDGNKTYNDMVRIRSGGEGTYDDILKGIQTLIDYDIKVDGLYVTISKENIAAINTDIFDIVKSLKLKGVTLEPEYTCFYPIPVDELAAKILYLKKLGSLENIWVTGSWKRPFNSLMSSRNQQGQDFYCIGVSGKGFAVSPSGGIFTCCNTLSKELGTVWQPDTLLKPNKYLLSFVESRYAGNIPGCKGCEIEGLCKGGCNMVNISAEVLKDKQLNNQRCELLKMITKELVSEWLDGYSVLNGYSAEYRREKYSQNMGWIVN